MRLFKCQSCANPIYFENTTCIRCGHQLGYVPDETNMSAIEPAGPGRFKALAAPGHDWKFCANAALDACNWLLPADSPATFCAACRHNHTVPNLSTPANISSFFFCYVS